MLRLRSWCARVAFYAITVLFLFIALPVFFLPPKQGRRIIQLWARSVIGAHCMIAGGCSEYRGLENLPEKGGYIVAVKHQSAWETLALVTLFPDFVFPLKEELMRIPVFGLYLRAAGMIPIARGKKGAVMRALLKDAGKALADGRTLIIFPEGTRTRPGAPADYKPGTAFLYAQLGKYPVVPVALNSGLYWPRGRKPRYPGSIIVEFLPAIPPGLHTRDFAARLETVIEEASDRLLLEAVDARPDLPLPPEAILKVAAMRSGENGRECPES